MKSKTESKKVKSALQQSVGDVMVQMAAVAILIEKSRRFQQVCPQYRNNLTKVETPRPTLFKQCKWDL